MISANSFRSYKTIATQTAPRGQLVLMLYEGAIRFLECALSGFQYEDPKEFNETINNNIIRGQDIIRELDSSLDLAQGGDLATTLRRLYNYMDDQLTQSNYRKTPEGIHDAIHRLSVLRDAWKEMLVQQGGGQRESESYPRLVAGS